MQLDARRRPDWVALQAKTGAPEAWLGTHTGYVLLGFPLAIASFSVLVTGLSAGLGTLVVVGGVPILAGTLFVARFFADV